MVTGATRWPDGTPVWRGPAFPEPWGNHPRDRWVRVMADAFADGVWHVAGVGRSCDDLPVGGSLVARIRAWQAWYDEEDGGPVAAFDAEGAAIARALREELPPGWTVLHTPLQA